MKRRTFVRSSSALLTGSLLSANYACMPNTTTTTTDARKNWAGNYEYHAAELQAPRSVGEVQELVRRYDRIKGLGTRHSFNSIADSPELQLSLQHFDRVIDLDEAAGTVTVGAGMRYGELCRFLHERGYALHNLASLPHISIAGACATATHGSGDRNGNLATAVTALELVTAAGEVATLSREADPESFGGAVVHLGALGIVTQVTLAVQPAYEAFQHVYLDLPLDQLERHFDDIFAGGYSVSLFTDWTRPRINQVWVKKRTEQGEEALPPELYGAVAADRDVHPIIEVPAENCTAQLGAPGPWYDRLPHFRLEFTPSSGEELQSEYFVPRRHAVDAILAVQALGERIAPHLFISEVRSIAADELWMSPCYRQDSVALHFTWKPDWPAVQQLLPLLEAELAPYGVRPHWGKLFTLDPRVLQARYERLDDFRALARTYDPKGKLRNGFLDRVL